MATTMTMPPMGGRWVKVQELVDSLGLTILSRKRTQEQWAIVFDEDLNQGQKTQLEARITHTISGVDWL